MGKEGDPRPKTTQATKWDVEQAREHAMNNLSNEAEERETEIANINDAVKKANKTPPPETPKHQKSIRQEEIDKQLEEWSPF